MTRFRSSRTKHNPARNKIITRSISLGRVPLGLVMFMVLAGSLLSWAMPLVLGESIDSMLGQQRSITLSFSGLRLLLYVGLGAVFVQFCNQILQKTYARTFLEYWIPRVCAKVSVIELMVLHANQTGYLNSRISSELRPIPALFSVEVPGLVESLLVIGFSLFMLLLLLPALTLALLGASLILVPTGLYAARRTRMLLKRVIETWSRFEGSTIEFIALQMQIRSYSAESRMCSYIHDRLVAATRTDLASTLRVLLLLTTIMVVTTGGLVAFLLYAEHSPGVATAGTGTVVAFLAYLWMFTGRVGGVTTAIGRIQNSLASLDRMTEFLELPERKQTHLSIPDGGIMSIRIRNLSASIEGTPVFQNVTFSAVRGEIVAVTGRSGCGKTTLLKTLFGLLDKVDGEILVNDTSIDGFKSLGDTAMYLPQDVSFFRGSLRWNLAMLSGAEVDDTILAGIISRLDLGNRLDASISQTTDLSEGGVNLSGGEKQRLALAAVLLRSPSVLLLDEPTSQLDDDTEQMIFQVIESLAATGSIVIVVTHNPSIERIATRTLRLDGFSSAFVWGGDDPE